MITTLIFSRPLKWIWSGTRFDREKAGEVESENQKRSQRYKRARFYSAQLGRFISRDPIGYVDGMSLYRAYFVPVGVDPEGLFLSFDWPSLPTFVPTQFPPLPPKEVILTVRACAFKIAEALKKVPLAYALIDPFCSRDVWDENGNRVDESGLHHPNQHCLWQCRLTIATDKKFAEKCGKQKEDVDLALCNLANSLPGPCWNMLSENKKKLFTGSCCSAYQPSDFTDNAVGRACGNDCTAKTDCAACCAIRGIPLYTPEGPGTARPYGPHCSKRYLDIETKPQS